MKKTAVAVMVIVVVVCGVIVPQMVIDTLAQPPEGPQLWVNDENPWVSRVFEVTCAEPGDSGAASIKVENKGETGNLTLHLLNLADSSVATTEPEGLVDPLELSILSQYVDMLIWDDDGDAIPEIGEGMIVEDTLYNIVCSNYTLGSLPAGVTMNIGIAWSLGCSAGNEIHSDRSTFDIQFAIY